MHTEWIDQRNFTIFNDPFARLQMPPDIRVTNIMHPERKSRRDEHKKQPPASNVLGS
jgi:hypothetical protein